MDDAERPFAQNNGWASSRARGQSGNPLSSCYEDYAEPWRDGRYVPMLTDRAAVEDDALGTLVLEPR